MIEGVQRKHCTPESIRSETSPAVEIHAGVRLVAVSDAVQVFKRRLLIHAIDALALKHDGVLHGVVSAGFQKGQDKAVSEASVARQFSKVKAGEDTVQLRIGTAVAHIRAQLFIAVLDGARILATDMTKAVHIAFLTVAHGDKGAINHRMYLGNIVGDHVGDGIQREETGTLVEGFTIAALQQRQLMRLLADLLDGILPIVAVGSAIMQAVETVAANQFTKLGGDEAAVDVGIEEVTISHHLTIEAAVLAKEGVAFIIQVHGVQLRHRDNSRLQDGNF